MYLSLCVNGQMKGSWRFLVDLQPLKGFCGSRRPQQRHLCLGCCSVGGPVALSETHLLNWAYQNVPNPILLSLLPPYLTFASQKSIWNLLQYEIGEWSILKHLDPLNIFDFSSFFHHFPALLSSLILIASLVLHPFSSFKLGILVHSAKWPLVLWMEERRWALDL